MSVWAERDKKYVNECGLLHPQTNQQPLGNKNVLSVIVNYKYWSSLYCSLLIMLNGLPLTIMKPLTRCVSVCPCMCVHMCMRMSLCLLIWGNMLSSFYGLEGSSALHWIYMFAVCLQVCLWCLGPKWRELGECRGGEMKNTRRVVSKTKANLTLIWSLWLITEHSALTQTFCVLRGSLIAEDYKGP